VGMPTPAPSTMTRRGAPSWRSGLFTRWAMPGRGGVRADRIPTHRGLTPRRRWCASFASTRRSGPNPCASRPDISAPSPSRRDGAVRDLAGSRVGDGVTVMIEAVLLDIDGTLIDNNALHLLAWQRALRRVGRYVDATTILHKLGMGSDKLPADILGPDDRVAVEKARQFHGEEYTDKGLIDHAEPLPGAAALLRALKDRGIRTALASSAKREEVEKSLAKLGRPSRALVIGDTVYDVDAARKAGLPCVCVLSGGIEREVLAKAGAAAIYVDAADVAAHLDAILAPPALS